MPAPIQQNSTLSTQFPDLSPVQAQIAAALAQGLTFTAAAQAAGIHRTTIYTWLKTIPAFRLAIEASQTDYLDQLRDEMVELSTLALKTLRQLMEDPKASPSVRLKAALAALNRKNWALPAKFERKVDNQITQQIDDLEKEMAEDLFPMPETTPRNAVCPCGSGQKYKRCCGVAAPPHLARQAA